MEYTIRYAIGIVTNTPTWVWLVLAALIYLGMQRTRTREMAQNRVLIPAAIFGLIAVSRLVLGHFAGPAVLGTLAGIIAAIALLVAVKPGRRARRIAPDRLRIEGEWFSLLLILVIFSVNYGVGVATAIQPALANSDDLHFLYGFVNATSAGFMIGRAAAYLNARAA